MCYYIRKVVLELVTSSYYCGCPYVVFWNTHEWAYLFIKEENVYVTSCERPAAT
jgi:hypothetical protein